MRVDLSWEWIHSHDASCEWIHRSDIAHLHSFVFSSLEENQKYTNRRKQLIYLHSCTKIIFIINFKLNIEYIEDFLRKSVTKGKSDQGIAVKLLKMMFLFKKINTKSNFICTFGLI